MQLVGHSFLITGGGSGLGAATAQVICARGGNVCLADVDAHLGTSLVGKLGASARFIATDVTCEADVQSALEFCLQEFGELRGVVNCAGILHAARIVGRRGPLPLEEFTRVVMVNLVGSFNVLRLAAAAMIDNQPLQDGERGVIVNTASAAAFEGQSGQAAYAASKAGVVGMTLPAARELAAHGIRVVSIAPGVFDTAMVAQMTPAQKDALVADIPFPSRLGQPTEFGELVAHVIENRMLNGTTIRLDGGLRMP